LLLYIFFFSPPPQSGNLRVTRAPLFGSSRRRPFYPKLKLPLLFFLVQGCVLDLFFSPSLLRNCLVFLQPPSTCTYGANGILPPFHGQKDNPLTFPPSSFSRRFTARFSPPPFRKTSSPLTPPFFFALAIKRRPAFPPFLQACAGSFLLPLLLLLCLFKLLSGIKGMRGPF